MRSVLLLCLFVLPVIGEAQKPPALDARERAFIAQATSDDAMQIALAQLAMSKSTNTKLRALASKIVSDHVALDLQFARLTATRGKSHQRDMPTGNVSAKKAHLQGLQGHAFDQAFADMMMKEQRKIIAAYELAERTSTDTRLRTIAARGRPVLQAHLDEASALMEDERLAERP